MKIQYFFDQKNDVRKNVYSRKILEEASKYMISTLQSSGVTHPGDGGKVLDVLHAHVQLTHELGAPELPHVQFVDVCDVGDAPQTALQNGHVHIPGNTLDTQHAKSYMTGKTQQRTLENFGTFDNR